MRRLPKALRSPAVFISPFTSGRDHQPTVRYSFLKRAEVVLATLFCVFFLFATQAGATTYTWTGNGGDQSWTNPNNWSPVGTPTSSDLVIVPTGFSVTNAGNALGLTNAGTVTFSTLTIGPNWTNSGVIQSDSNTATSGYLYVPASQTATLTGGGSVQLNKSSSNINGANSNSQLVNQDNLIHGYGTVNVALTNNGTVSADSSGHTLTVSNSADINNSIFQATGGGTLDINASVDNTNGTIKADGAGSVVILDSGTVTGGTLTTLNGGLIQGSGGTLNNLTNAGTVTFNNNVLYLEGTINNSGVIQSDSNTATSGYLYVPASQTATLTGGGSVQLNKSSSNINGANSNSQLVNQDNLIHGYGQINIALVNNGTSYPQTRMGIR